MSINYFKGGDLLRLLRNYKRPIKLEVFTSVGLIIATLTALLIYNSPFRYLYIYIFNSIKLGHNFSLHMFINDFLMAIFFLVAGLEIKHEILHGNLSTLKKASFPVIGALGGVIVPALLFLIINKETPFLKAFCIPISTDIAFAIGVYIMFSKKLNPSLKIFLLSLAVVDDLVSILAIGIVYSTDINTIFLGLACSILILLYIANKIFKVKSMWYYLISGLCLWYFIHLSGVHSTISGVLLALMVPSDSVHGKSTLEKIQRLLVPINSIIIIPLFAFANTGISLNFTGVDFSSAYPLAIGIILGLCIGKPLGIMLFSYIGCLLGLTEKPKNISWFAIFLVSLIAGIGFTMSIFVSEIAFIHDLVLINIAKASILISAFISVVVSSTAINTYYYYLKIKISKYTKNIYIS